MSRSTGLLLTLCLLVLGGCLLRGGAPDRIVSVGPAAQGREPAVHDPVPPAATARASSRPSLAALVADDPYAKLAEELHARGVGVWFEADLVARWLEGPQAFQEGLDRLGKLAALPGVRGVKVADELGYNDGINTPAQAKAFLQAVRTGLARTSPHTPVLIDVVVPELGCLAWTSVGSAACAAEGRAKHPAASAASVDDYLRSGLVDRLDLSTSLLDEWTYRAWGVTQAQAQELAWRHVNRLGWDRHTALQARKALADIGGYQGSDQQATDDVNTFVTVPTEAGARAVDIWTWRQQYDGHTVSLVDSALSANPLWRRLAADRRAGIRLFTHMTPSLLLPTAAERDLEYAMVAQVFDAVFVAAGTG